MIRRLYDWVIRLAQHRHAIPAMGVVSFLESSFFPIPPDVMLVPMVLANRRQGLHDRAGLHRLLGAGRPAGLRHRLLLLRDDRRLGGEDLRAAGRPRRRSAPASSEYGTWIILIKGLTPIPYKLVTIASGAAHFDLFTFVWASIVTRGLRFFLVAALLWKFGEPIRAFIEKRLTLLTWLFLIALVGGFVAVRFLF